MTTAPALSPVAGDFRPPAPEVLRRLGDGPLSAAGRLALDAGRIVGRHRHGTLASAFQPIVAARDGSVAGHQAYVRPTGVDGKAAAPWAAFAHCANGHETVRLDRLCRTVHAANWLTRPRDGQRLFLRVEQRLLDTVADDYGHAFEDILLALGARPSQMAIVLPASALEDPTVFVRASLAYRSRGYGVVATLRTLRNLAWSSLALAQPTHVMLPPPAADQVPAAGRVVRVVHDMGACAIACNVETAPQAAWSHVAGFDFLQGFHFGEPGPDAAPPRSAP
jgi:EAL domain-containing protein (putative c-di-GMP-specific phosphodiesterase class I)